MPEARRLTGVSEGLSLHSASRKSRRKSKFDLEALKKELAINDHMITLDDLCQRYSTSLTEGLFKDQAAQLLIENGPNRLQPPKPKSRWLILAENLFYGFASLLWIGSILSIVAYLIEASHMDNPPLDHVYLGSCLFFTVIFTGFFGYYQESENRAIIEGFSKMVPKIATVIRDGRSSVVQAEELVLGDLVAVKSGDCIPADIRVIESKDMKVDNSSLTGESEPQLRSSDCTDKNPMETQNLAFYGTNVVEGSGKGIVIACGDDTLIGHIAGLTSGNNFCTVILLGITVSVRAYVGLRYRLLTNLKIRLPFSSYITIHVVLFNEKPKSRQYNK